MTRAAAVLLAALLLAGCTGDDEPPAPAAAPESSPSSAVPPPAEPADRACYALEHGDALSATSDAAPVDCSTSHTTMTFHVGEIDAVVDGHLLAVDSEHVQAQVASRCPALLPAFVGGTIEDRRLSMLRSVWFTPSLEDSDAGADWFRCDVVALAGEGELAPLTGRLADVLSRPSGRNTYGMCGTAEPGSPRFDRVICSRKHTWRAIAVVPLRGSGYPGEARVRSAGQQRCEDAGAAAADDALDYRWGYEWPTADQWDAGQTYGICWAPD